MQNFRRLSVLEILVALNFNLICHSVKLVMSRAAPRFSLTASPVLPDSKSGSAIIREKAKN